jgi:hypothetical protein
MEFCFFYGPDKIPFSIDGEKIVLSDYSIPFHGIISKGLLIKLEEEGVNSKIWYKYAHLVGNNNTLEQELDLTRLQKCVYGCEALSFSSSAISVKIYVDTFIAKSSKDEQLTCEIWNVKEGHTSSVWKVTIINTNNLILDQFVINVARDRAAGIELQSTAEKMITIAENCPGINMAKVYGIEKVSLNYFHEIIDIVITRNEWIPDAREIHFFPGNERQAEQYVLVERFLTSHDRPSQITSIHGRKFTESESNQIKDDIAFFLANACKVLPTCINLNEGDVVWTGKKAVIVAIS